MKPMSAALLGVMLCSLPHGNAGATTTDELLSSCKAINTVGAAPGAAIDIPVSGVPCWFYMSAIQNMSTLVDGSGSRMLGICLPTNGTLLDLVRLFVQYAGRIPSAARENAAAVAVIGLSDAFPCKPSKTDKISIDGK